MSKPPPASSRSLLSLSAPTLSLEGLVILNASFNAITSVAEGAAVGSCDASLRACGCGQLCVCSCGRLRAPRPCCVRSSVRRVCGMRTFGPPLAHATEPVSRASAPLLTAPPSPRGPTPPGAQASCPPALACSTCRSTASRRCPHPWAARPCCSRCTWPTTSECACVHTKKDGGVTQAGCGLASSALSCVRPGDGISAPCVAILP